MAKKLSFAANRRERAWLLRWSLLAFVGIIGGIWLGEMAAGSRPRGGSSDVASFSRLSANPDALVAESDGTDPCLDCADSYGVAMRLRANSDDRMSDEFRALGEIKTDEPTPADPQDDYRYGGRFPDREPQMAPTIGAPDVIVAAGERTPGGPVQPVPPD
ncbi:hypothetical protein [Sphingopyxis sp. RIFCSPHIGHO2_12_FULL_65_19]|uniref:hypothetical protein n=1 Tax=Sphingopyxis sp. RIFCSPHIGHO2_12_FULL_65_19 TaxID=1802172 RepID=UPI0008C275ED|nr:hypothetical protein [Sphingopyxis sp. RIFCSPHIGHO2_12_FULL_65_19]OHD06909.1 MAG: hypothetical protein A3E77_10665 [Sphingopyxis sp. RIFCSPHIGHO2_12_FULL_65_19]